MQDEQKIEIVDGQGKAFKKAKESKITQFLGNNIWNILGTGLGAVIVFMEMISMVFSRRFSISCAEYYGMSRKYFSGTELFEDKLYFIICAILIAVYPLFFSYLNKKIKDKLYVFATFIVTIFILFYQNIIYTINLLEIIPWEGLKGVIDNCVTLIIFIVADIVIAYFIIIRPFFYEKKKYHKAENVILSIALLIYILSTSMGIAIKLNYDISDKKAYEIIEQERAIISNYDGKFVVMDCEIQDETIILKKGTFSLEEMTGVSITYHEYEKVICE